MLVDEVAHHGEKYKLMGIAAILEHRSELCPFCYRMLRYTEVGMCDCCLRFCCVRCIDPCDLCREQGVDNWFCLACYPEHDCGEAVQGAGGIPQYDDGAHRGIVLTATNDQVPFQHAARQFLRRSWYSLGLGVCGGSA